MDKDALLVESEIDIGFVKKTALEDALYTVNLRDLYGTNLSAVFYILTLCILMDSYFWFYTINFG